MTTIAANPLMDFFQRQEHAEEEKAPSANELDSRMHRAALVTFGGHLAQALSLAVRQLHGLPTDVERNQSARKIELFAERYQVLLGDGFEGDESDLLFPRMPEDRTREFALRLNMLAIRGRIYLLGYLEREAPSVAEQVRNSTLQAAAAAFEALGWSPPDVIETLDAWRSGSINAIEAGRRLNLPADAAGAFLLTTVGRRVEPISDEIHAAKLARLEADRAAKRVPAMDEGFHQRQAIFAASLEGRDVRHLFGG